MSLRRSDAEVGRVALEAAGAGSARSTHWASAAVGLTLKEGVTWDEDLSCVEVLDNLEVMTYVGMALATAIRAAMAKT